MTTNTYNSPVMRILAIETSCDETGVAILEAAGSKARPTLKTTANIVSSQVKIHEKFGGVVPNLAKREHQKNLVPVLMRALAKAGLLHKGECSLEKNIDNLKNIFSHEPELLTSFLKSLPLIVPPAIDAIAVTYGPGLAPALWTGVNFTRALSLIWEKPLIPVNHLAGHIYVNLTKGKIIKFPALCLIVSGGHTELVIMKKHNHFQVIGETQDDAAGEAFDKVAKLLGIGFPGGPAISKLAESIENKNWRLKTKLPRPLLHSHDYNFSYSGLKTSVLYFLRDNPEAIKTQRGKAEIANEFQNAAIEPLIKKTIRAAKEYKVKTLILGGGVAANKKLRKDIKAAASKELTNVQLLLPEVSETTDNALMIAAAAFFTKKRAAWRHLHADPSLRLDAS